MRRLGVVAWLPAVAYMGLIFGISSLSLTHTHLPKFSDKAIHFVEYGVLAAFVTFGFRQTRGAWSARTIAFAAWVWASVYGATDEWHQLYVPHRSSSVYDWLADTLGAALMAALLVVAWRKREETRGADDPALPRQEP